MMRKKSSKEGNSGSYYNQNHDLFSSIMMSRSGPEMGGSISRTRSTGKSNDYLDGMLRENKLLRESVREFNIECEKKMKKADLSGASNIDEFQAIKFNESQTFTIEMNSIRAYILKYQTLK